MRKMPFGRLVDACTRPKIALPTPDLGRIILCQETHDALRRLSGSHEFLAEIGSWRGFSALKLAEWNPVAIVLCIDPWLGSAELMEMDSLRALISESYVQFLANTEHLKQRIWPLRTTGIDGLALAWDCDYVPSLIFIDGSHQYESVWGDIHAARRLFPEATLVLDDASQPDVEQAIKELIPHAQFTGNVAVYEPDHCALCA